MLPRAPPLGLKGTVASAGSNDKKRAAFRTPAFAPDSFLTSQSRGRAFGGPICKNLKVHSRGRTRPACGGRRANRSGAGNVYWYGEERRKDTTRGAIGQKGHAFGFVPVPIAEHPLCSQASGMPTFFSAPARRLGELR